MQIEILDIDILAFDGDAIVVPTVSSGAMAEGLSARVKSVVGQAAEDEVVGHAPIAVGAALVTPAASLKVTYLIHAPLLETAGLRVGVENIRRATRASLLAAQTFSMERIAIPGMGHGETGVSPEEAARAMIDEVVGFKGAQPVSVALVDGDPDMIEALEAHVR